MAKKKFRPRTGGGRSGGQYSGGGYNAGGYSGGGQGGGGNGRPRRRRRQGGDRSLDPDSRGPGGQQSDQPGVPAGEAGIAPAEVALEPGYGLLEMHPNGYGFLRSPDNNYSRERSDPFVPGTMIEKYGLRQGLMIRGAVQPARRQQGPRLREITDVDGMPPDDYINVKGFDTKTPINPDRWFRLETGALPLTTRVMDLLTPLGRGQRALIVAPPRSGKTILLQHISHGIATNYPDVKVIVLLIDERPEEVTDMRRNVPGEVIASSLDNDVESHVRLSQMIIERAKRLAEMGQDVFVLLDSITRLARAFNKWVGNQGGTMSGGLNIKAMDVPKKLFATARAFEEGGSLTIVGTALIETNSRMDDAIFQEFKGTGNMELVLDRKLAERRVWPAIDVTQSGTRREELLLDADTLHAVTMLRRTLSSMHPVDAMEQLTKQLGRFKTNAEFIKLISSARAMD
jgi:transcription termination factor Rho